jgi:NDP-sugar pyrophosphorylase family protein
MASFQEKDDSDKGGWINAGIYHLNVDILLNRDLNFSVERDVFPQMATSGALTAIQIKTDFIDIGIPDDFIKFCNWVKSGKSFNL